MAITWKDTATDFLSPKQDDPEDNHPVAWHWHDHDHDPEHEHIDHANLAWRFVEYRGGLARYEFVMDSESESGQYHYTTRTYVTRLPSPQFGVLFKRISGAGFPQFISNAVNTVTKRRTLVVGFGFDWVGLAFPYITSSNNHSYAGDCFELSQAQRDADGFPAPVAEAEEDE